jgi:hypothetical protein
MSSTMLSASLPVVEAYDAFSLNPVEPCYRRRASPGQPSDLRVENFLRDCLGCFCRFERRAGDGTWRAQIGDLRLVAARESIMKNLVG